MGDIIRYTDEDTGSTIVGFVVRSHQYVETISYIRSYRELCTGKFAPSSKLAADEYSFFLENTDLEVIGQISELERLLLCL